MKKTKIDKRKSASVDHLLISKVQLGVPPEILNWLSLRRQYFHARDASSQLETLPSEIEFKTPFYWSSELQKSLNPEYQGESCEFKSTSDNADSYQDFISRFSMTPAKELLIQAIDARHQRFLEFIISNGIDINIPIDSLNRSALHLAVHRGDLKKTMLLLSHGANVLATDSKGRTPLFMSIKSLPFAFEAMRMTRSLLDAASDVNAQTNTGTTALHQACLTGNLAVVEMLLKYGADVFVLDKKGKVAVQYVTTEHRDAILTCFRNNESPSNKSRYNLMWSFIMSREFVKQIFMEVEPTCVKCRRKYSLCATLKTSNFRFWLLVHEKNMI